MSAWSIGIPFIILLTLLFAQGFQWPQLPYFIFVPFGAFIVFKTDSIAYAFWGQFLFTFLIDTAIVIIAK